MDSLIPMEEKYKYVKNMLSQDLINFLTSFSLKNIRPGDRMAPTSSAMHSANSEIYTHISYHLHPMMELQTKLKLKPIYSYNRVYYGGSELKKHKDRPSCEISASIALNYNYENLNYKWPLCMGDTPLVIKPGDGVIYKGAEIDHWRPVFNEPKTSWHHQLFVHYVDTNGPFKDYEVEDSFVNLNQNLKRESKIKNS